MVHEKISERLLFKEPLVVSTTRTLIPRLVVCVVVLRKSFADPLVRFHGSAVRLMIQMTNRAVFVVTWKLPHWGTSTHESFHDSCNDITSHRLTCSLGLEISTDFYTKFDSEHWKNMGVTISSLGIIRPRMKTRVGRKENYYSCLSDY